MPRKLEIDALQAELAELEALLAALGPNESPISRFQLNERRNTLQENLQRLAADFRPSASVAIIFGGAPVLGAKGIDAEFAGKSLDGFQSLITRRFAEMELGELGRRGPVAFEQHAKLMVTNTVRGSFGFVLEELSDQTTLAETQLKVVVSDVTTILDRVAGEDEALFEEIASTLDARTLGSLRKFLDVMDDSEATMKLVDDDRTRSFDRQAVHRARVRADMTEIEDRETQAILGTLQGYLPDHRKFEFRQQADGQVLYGSFTSDFMRRYRELLEAAAGKTVSARFRVREVKHRNLPPKTTYTLVEILEAAEPAQ